MSNKWLVILILGGGLLTAIPLFLDIRARFQEIPSGASCSWSNSGRAGLCSFEGKHWACIVEGKESACVELTTQKPEKHDEEYF